MSAPVRGEVREAPNGDRYYIEGPPANPWDYTGPMIRCIEVEGPWAKVGYVVPREQAEGWRIVSAPVEVPA